MLLVTGAVAAMPLLAERRPPELPQATGLLPERGQQPLVRPASNRSAKDAARQAQAQNGGGRVLAVEETDGGWRVKLLKEGTVRFVAVPD